MGLGLAMGGNTCGGWGEGGARGRGRGPLGSLGKLPTPRDAPNIRIDAPNRFRIDAPNIRIDAPNICIDAPSRSIDRHPTSA